MANLRMLIDWCIYEVAEPYCTIALPNMGHENELLIRRENKSLTNKRLHNGVAPGQRRGKILAIKYGKRESRTHGRFCTNLVPTVGQSRTHFLTISHSLSKISHPLCLGN